MKKRLYSALIVLTMVLSLLPMNIVFAETVESGTCGDGVTWTLDSEGTLTISGSGAMEDRSSSSYSQWAWKCKSLVVESGVTYIGAYAFYNCQYLTNITIKSNVQKIGSNAFSNCIKLTEVNLDDDIAFIESSAFSNCSSLISINIPKQIKTINAGTFGNCTSLETVNIPDGIKEIGYAAFSSCTKLKKITLPDSITTLGERAFEKCSLISISKLPKMLSKMGTNVFQGCASIERIDIPETLTEISTFAFADCTALKRINIPSSVKTINCWAFKNCTGLEEVHISDVSAWCNISFKRGSWDVFEVNPLYYAKNLYLDKKLVTDLVIPDNVTQISDYAFVNCSSITSITIPKSVTSIGTSAFANCNSIKTVNYCGNSSEWDAINLSGGNDAIGSANKIYNYVASGSCGDNATWVYDSNNILTINGSGLIEVYRYNGFNMPYSVNTPWDKYKNEIKKIIINNGITHIGDFTFCDCINAESVVLPDTLTSFGVYSFINCDKLTTINIPKSVSSFSYYPPFAGCDSLKQIRVNNQNANFKSVNGILYSKDGTKLLTFPNKAKYADSIFDGVSTIKRGAFWGNTTIESMTLPETVKEIENAAFYLCKNLKSIYLNEGLERISSSSTSYEVAFYECSSLESVHLPSTLKMIPSFFYCEKLKEITYSDGFEPKSMGSFLGCSSLEKMKIPNSVNYWNSRNFSGCTNLKEVFLSEEITYIPSNAFKDCVSLNNLVLPRKVSQIFQDAFIRCTNLQTLTIPKTLTKISENAFKDCDSLETIYYEGTQEEWNSIDISSTGNDALNYADVVYNYTPTTILLDKNELSLYRGESIRLTATVSPEDTTVSWSSDDKDIATVSDDGTITAKSTGKTNIVATANNGVTKAICVVNVLPVPVTGVSLDKSEVSLKIGSSEKLTATVIPETAENKNVKWSSDDNDVVSVDENGNVTAKSIGSAIVTATTEVGGFTAQCTVTVLPIAVSDITLDKTELSIAEGTSAKVSASVFPENATDKTVLWSSNNENVATVENGTITAVSQGTAVIVAKTKDGSHTAYCAVTVTAANVPVKSISLNQSTLTIVEGYTDTLTATISPSNATNKTITWSTNNSKVATVENGTVQAIAPGTAVIIATAEDGGQIATCIVNVISSMQDSVSKPIASILSGAVKEGANVLLLCATRGAQIHYTTDGSAPTKDSPLYTEPIQINSAVKIKAIALKSGMLDSEVASFSYTIADPDIPYVSVQTNLTGNKGDFTTVSVNISENSGSAGGSFNLVYDNTAVELMSVENGSYISKANPIVNDTYAANKVRTVWAGSKKLEGGGEILTAQFRILDDTDKDTAYFSLEKLKIADDNAVKMKCVQSDGVLALMTAESAAPDKEFVTEPTFGTDNKTVSVFVTSNEDYSGKMYVAVYDTNNKLIQLKCTDVKNNEVPYDIVFDKEIVPGQCVKVFIWNEVMCPLSDVKMLYK